MDEYWFQFAEYEVDPFNPVSGEAKAALATVPLRERQALWEKFKEETDREIHLEMNARFKANPTQRNAGR